MKKNFPNFLITIAISIIIIGIAIYLNNRSESFGATSPGTLVQLASSHVPTQEDLYYYTKVYPKVVRREVADMTGSDPGEIALYPFQ